MGANVGGVSAIAACREISTREGIFFPNRNFHNQTLLRRFQLNVSETGGPNDLYTVRAGGKSGS